MALASTSRLNALMKSGAASTAQEGLSTIKDVLALSGPHKRFLWATEAG